MQDNSSEKIFEKATEPRRIEPEEREILSPSDKAEQKEEREMAPQAEIQAERERISQQVAKAQFTPKEEAEAKKETVKIKRMDSQGKLQRLLAIAQDKGVIFAVKVASDLGDPYALDMLHDILAKDENYKKLQQ